MACLAEKNDPGVGETVEHPAEGGVVDVGERLDRTSDRGGDVGMAGLRFRGFCCSRHGTPSGKQNE